MNFRSAGSVRSVIRRFVGRIEIAGSGSAGGDVLVFFFSLLDGRSRRSVRGVISGVIRRVESGFRVEMSGRSAGGCPVGGGFFLINFSSGREDSGLGSVGRKSGPGNGGRFGLGGEGRRVGDDLVEGVVFVGASPGLHNERKPPEELESVEVAIAGDISLDVSFGQSVGIGEGSGVVREGIVEDFEALDTLAEAEGDGGVSGIGVGDPVEDELSEGSGEVGFDGVLEAGEVEDGGRSSGIRPDLVAGGFAFVVLADGVEFVSGDGAVIVMVELFEQVDAGIVDEGGIDEGGEGISELVLGILGAARDTVRHPSVDSLDDEVIDRG